MSYENTGMGLTLRLGSQTGAIAEQSRLDPNSDAYKELYFGRTTGPEQNVRSTGISCEETPNGKIYRETDWKDNELYPQAGCVSLGARRTRAGIERRSTVLPFVVSGRYEEVWCCDQANVEDVFEQWTQSSTYQSRSTTIKVLLVGAIIGAGYLGWREYKRRVHAGEDVDFTESRRGRGSLSWGY